MFYSINLQKMKNSITLILVLYVLWPVRGQKRSNFGQNRQIRVKSGRLVEIYPIYTCFDSEFCSKFNSRFFEVKWGHPEVKIGSNLGQNRQIGVKSSRLVQIYPVYIFFDSEFCPEFKFKIIKGQIRSSRGQT